MGKKAEKEARRREMAIRRMRLQTFIALLIPVMQGWIIGLKGGGYDGYIRYNAIEAAPKEKKYILMQAGRINKARDTLVREAMGLEAFKAAGNAFFATADKKLMSIAEKIVSSLPDTQTHYEQTAVLTYILYCAFYDYAALEADDRPQLKHLISVLGTFANHVLPAGSPLCAPFNRVYWATRDDLQANPDWTRGGTLEWLPSKDEREMMKEKGRDHAEV